MDLETRRVVNEELWRSIVWAGIGLFGWGILAGETALLEANVLTLLSVPFLTWTVLTTTMIGTRIVTGTELQVQSKTGLSLFVTLGVLAGGVASLFLVAVVGYSALSISSLYVAISAITVLWVWHTVFPNFEPRTLPSSPFISSQRPLHSRQNRIMNRYPCK
ncbi:hypothetical protein MUK72_04305 [Halococcus dombrowskii]|uniref:Uncharacterized protein n=1 Tax=Halococcus dombrowskii TaxID=179637 RepID=A0AAX3ATF0_HALDO|nr:hypothetical protein [Halococcus dombrowskii]UOO95933.1 hypothetical protein MUK72_04305 [Halococcus dombrowskii]